MSRIDSLAPLPVAVLSVVKHDYVARGVLSHHRFVPAVVADDADQPAWVHARNEGFAGELGVPYVRDVASALADFGARVAVVSSQAERHCDLSVRAVRAGLHVVQDKPMSTRVSECDRLAAAVAEVGVKFLLWNRNLWPALTQAHDAVSRGDLGRLRSIHVDFYFAKDAGPPLGTRGPDDPPLVWLESLRAAHATGADGGVGTKAMGELEVEGIYPLAYMRLLSAAKIHRVFARAKSHFHQLHADNQVDDLATVTLEMAGGSVGTLCIGRIGAASHPDLGEIKLHVVGSDGALVISEARPEVSVYYRGQPAGEYPHVRVANDNDWLLADNFARAIDDDGETLLDAPAARDICAVVHAALESARTGRPVDVA